MTSNQLPAVISMQGHALPEYQEIADVFAQSLAKQGLGGASLTIYEHGRQVLDLAGGDAADRPVMRVFSVSKCVAALASLHAAQAGMIALDRPIAEFWPDFARPATDVITTRMILSHSSGICGAALPMSTDDLFDTGFESIIAAQDPLWPPGTRHGYAALIFGTLLNGVFKRTTGHSLASYVAAHLAGPLGAEFWFGVAPPHRARLAPLHFQRPVLRPRQVEAFTRGEVIFDGSMVPIQTNAPAFFDDPRVIEADWPAMAGAGTSNGLARLLAAAVGEVDGVRLLGDQWLCELIQEQVFGWDRTLLKTTRFGSGVELPHVHLPLLGPRSFGHQGAGGSVVAADPDRKIAMAFLTNAAPPVPGASDHALAVLAALKHQIHARN